MHVSKRRREQSNEREEAYGPRPRVAGLPEEINRKTIQGKAPFP